MFHFICIYLVCINFISFILMGADKHRARKKLWRISEKTLFLAALSGGSLGSVAGMYYFRHKTKHTSFTVGMPCILIIQFLFISFLLTKFM